MIVSLINSDLNVFRSAKLAGLSQNCLYNREIHFTQAINEDHLITAFRLNLTAQRDAVFPIYENKKLEII